MVRKGVSEAEKAIEERNEIDFKERTKEYELKLKESESCAKRF